MEQADRSAKIYVAGHRGLVGSAVVRALRGAGFRNIVTRSKAELDLRNQNAANAFFAAERPRYVIGAAAKVGGILANATHPGTFLYDNLMIEANLIEACRINEVRRLLFLGSTCVYPKFAPQPIPETALLTGPLEETNEAYAIAKIAGLKLCQAYDRQYGLKSISLMPTNLYGPGDNFDLTSSHVLPALMHKAHVAKTEGRDEIVVWGTGQPLREFLHVDDLASAVLFCLDNVGGTEILNVGSGTEISIAGLAQLICEVVGYKGPIRFDPTKPDGTPRKLADTRLIRGLGWKPEIGLREGLETTYAWYQQQRVNSALAE